MILFWAIYFEHMKMRYQAILGGMEINNIFVKKKEKIKNENKSTPDYYWRWWWVEIMDGYGLGEQDFSKM